MKLFPILVMLIFGIFLMPQVTFACEMKSKKSCCNKEMSTSNSDKMDCCKSVNKSNSNNNDHEGGCNGKCGHSNCVTTSIQFSVVFFEIQFKNNNFAFSEKKQNYFKSDTNLSSGFYSLWLIPKIS